MNFKIFLLENISQNINHQPYFQQRGQCRSAMAEKGLIIPVGGKGVRVFQEMSQKDIIYVRP